MTAIWIAGQAWPAELPAEIDETGLTIITRRGTSHRLTRDDGALVWTRQSRGGQPYTPFPPTAIGQPTPCGFAVEGRGLHDWWASSRIIYLGTGDIPTDETIDELIRIGTGPIDRHPDHTCQAAVYCDRVADTIETRRAHLADIFETIATNPWQT